VTGGFVYLKGKPMEKLALDARKQILEKHIAGYTRLGYRVTMRTDTTVQLMKPKQFSCLWASLWFLAFGIGLLFYVFWYAAKKDHIVYLSVDEYGRVSKR